MTICKCKRKLNYSTTPYMSAERRVCACGRLHNVDNAPINWWKALGGKE